MPFQSQRDCRTHLINMEWSAAVSERPAAAAANANDFRCLLRLMLRTQPRSGIYEMGSSNQLWVARCELPRVSNQRIRKPVRLESVLLRQWYPTLSGLWDLPAMPHGRPSLSRANHGLTDVIPLGLNHGSLFALRKTSIPHAAETSEEPINLPHPPKGVPVFIGFFSGVDCQLAGIGGWTFGEGADLSWEANENRA